MTNEEIQRVMEFIIKQQESFAENMELMRESHVRAEERISKLEMAFVGLFSVVTDISKSQKEFADKVSNLADKVTELAEAQLHTDQRLNVVIDIIERGQGGRPQQ
jgi:uncharacterized protein YoxC